MVLENPSQFNYSTKITVILQLKQYVYQSVQCCLSAENIVIAAKFCLILI